MIEDDLFARLASWFGLTALVGSKIYPVFAPPTVDAPYVTYRIRSRSEGYDFAGPTGFVETTLEVTAWGERYEDARRVATQVRLCLNGWSVSPPHLSMLQDQFDGADVDNKPFLYFRSQVYAISHLEE